jgi:hypothetical protein
MAVVSVQVWTVVPPTCRLTDSWPLVPRARTTIVLLPPVLDDDELVELLDELELLLEDEELDELDDELLLELLDVPSPAQLGATKLPS